MMIIELHSGEKHSLTRHNTTLAKLIGVDDPAKIEEVRAYAKKVGSDVYVVIDPYADEILGIKELLYNTDSLALAKEYEDSCDDI